MKTKTKKIVKSITVGVACSFVIYFGLGIISTLVATEGFINVRNCDLDLLEEDFYRMQKTRKDYPSLANREEIPFDCEGETLMGYLYKNTSPKGVIVFAHGVQNIADANMAQLHDYFYRCNYDVFSFDLTGCGRSTGRGIKSFYESTSCVTNAINKVKSLDTTKDLPLFLIGHSWGAYGVVTASNKVDGVLAVASFSAYNAPNEIFYGSLEYNTSKAAILFRPAVEFGLYTHWGRGIYYSAEEVIKNSPYISYYVVHGDEDGVVPLNKYSLYDNIVNDNYQNTTLVKLEGVGHSNPWKNKDALRIIDEYDLGLTELKNKYNGHLPNEIREEYFASLDLDKSSEVNAELLNNIDQLFSSKIN